MVACRVGNRWAICLLSLLWLAPTIARADISVRANVNVARAQVGQAVVLSIEIQGAQSVQAPSLNNLDGFEARYVGPSTQVSIVNGQMSAAITHRYALTPIREGVFTIGPFTIEHEGKSYETNQIQLAVSAAADTGSSGAAGGNRGDALRLRLSGREGDIFVHERFPIEVTLFVRSTQVADIAFPTISSAGLSIEAFAQPERGSEQIDGMRYEILRFRSFAVPLQSGPRALGPATIHLNVITQGSGFFFSQKRGVDLQSNVLDLNVLPLPSEGRPGDFNGAIGQFDLDVSASPVDLSAGDPVTLKMTLRGDGNLTDSQPPALSSADGFRVYDPQPGKNDPPGMRTFEQVLIPESDRIKEIPPVRISFFDPRSRQYRTASSAPIRLNVRPAANAAAPQIIAAPGQSPVAVPESLGRDIVYIKDDPGDLRGLEDPWYSWLALLWLPVPLAALLAATLYDRQRQRLTGDARYARYSRAGKLGREGVAQAENALQQGRVEESSDLLSRTVREYLAAKLDVPVGAIDAEAAARRGVSAEDVAVIRSFFATLEESRYAGRMDATRARELLESARLIVEHLESRRGRGRR